MEIVQNNEEFKTGKIHKETNKKMKEFVSPMDFIEFLKNENEDSEEFCYLNKRSHAYDWEVVEFNSRSDTEYITLSKRVYII